MSIHSSMTSIDRLSGVGASAGGLSSALGVARRGRSAGCVLCLLWAISAAVLGGGLAFTRYSFASRRLCTNQPPLDSPRPPALPTLCQYFCTTTAQYTTPLRPHLCMPYTIQHSWWQYHVKAKGGGWYPVGVNFWSSVSWTTHSNATQAEHANDSTGAKIGLCTILSLPIWYRAWHANGGSGRRRILRNRRAMALQLCGQCSWEGAIEEWLIRA